MAEQPIIEKPVKDEKDSLNVKPGIDNKILSDMVEVLIDLRDDKSQKLILNEAIAIRKMLVDQSKKIELPGGIEPNTEETKQEDREKLAEAIARRLSDVIGNLSSGGIPMLSRPANPVPGAPPAAAAGAGSALLAGSVIGGVAVGGAALSYGATNVLKNMSTEQRTQLMGDVGSDTSIAAAALNEGDKLPEERAKEERKNKLLENAPWYTRMYGIGETEFLKNPTNIEGVSEEEASNARKNYARVDPRRTDVAPKETQLKLKDMLNQVNEENTQLKMYTESQSTQTLAPIVSNKTINNTEQTIIGAPSSPHSSTNSFMRWQNKRSAYTD